LIFGLIYPFLGFLHIWDPVRIELNIQIFIECDNYTIFPEGFAAPLRRFLSRILLQLFSQKGKNQPKLTHIMTIQILSYEFLGPIRLSEWGPPMEESCILFYQKTRRHFRYSMLTSLAKPTMWVFLQKTRSSSVGLRIQVSKICTFVFIQCGTLMKNSEKGSYTKL
jgi:hypothetical protein